MIEKLLIIGCVDIGQRLARQLAPAGYAVTGLRRRATIDLPYVRFRQGDATQADQLNPLLAEGFDVIVVSLTPAEQNDQAYKKAYVDTCQQLIKGLDQQPHQPRLILFISSTAVYAQNTGEWIDELFPALPESFSGKRLLEAEQIILGSGYSSSVVRFSGIYGPGRHRLIEQVLNQRASASPHYTNRIHANDCAAVLAHLVERAKLHSLDSLYLATDSHPAPMAEVVSWIAERLALQDYLAADAINERGNKRIANKRLLETGFNLRYPDFKAGYAELLANYHT